MKESTNGISREERRELMLIEGEKRKLLREDKELSKFTVWDETDEEVVLGSSSALLSDAALDAMKTLYKRIDELQAKITLVEENEEYLRFKMSTAECQANKLKVEVTALRSHPIVKFLIYMGVL